MGAKQNLMFLLIFSYSLSVLGNAQPIDILSSLRSTGNLVALKKTDIQIKEEKLKITIDGTYSFFEVYYNYFNNGNEETVDLAFPVDFVVGLFDARDNPQNKDLNIFGVEVNGEKAIYDHIIEKQYCCDTGSCSGEPKDLSYNNEKCDGKMTRKWYVTKIKFSAGKETKVSIKYKIHSSSDPVLYNISPIPLINLRHVKYDFSPAQYFGSGKAEKIEIVLDLKKVKNTGGKLIEIKPKILKETEKGIYSYSGKDFDFKKNPNFSIEYDVKDLEMFNYFKTHRKTEEYPAIPHWAVSSSIDDKKYGIRNLFDGKANTAWCFKAEKDPWVEIELLPTLPLRYVSVINGYLKDKQNYEENGKVTEFEVITDCHNKDNCIYCGETYESEKNYKPEIPVWNDIFLNNPFLANREIWRIKESDYLLKKPCKVKILIKNTTKGKKYDDICISEIFLM